VTITAGNGGDIRGERATIYSLVRSIGQMSKPPARQGEHGKGGRPMKKEGYAGKIQNAGAQVVKAPAQSQKKGNGKVTTGSDLRTGKGKGSR